LVPSIAIALDQNVPQEQRENCPPRPGGREQADADLDWSKIDLEALRQHLFDMNEVTLKADAATKTIDGGLEIAVTGSGRTLAAIQQMD
jgi:hypothetical protein